MDIMSGQYLIRLSDQEETLQYMSLYIKQSIAVSKWTHVHDIFLFFDF